MNNDLISKIIDCCKKRESILEQSRSMREYNKYYEKMCNYMRCLIDSKCEGELLPYLNDESISVQFDIAILLYNSFPTHCKKTLEEISVMNVEEGLPKHLIIVTVAAYNNLKYGIPINFP